MKDDRSVAVGHDPDREPPPAPLRVRRRVPGCDTERRRPARIAVGDLRSRGGAANEESARNAKTTAVCSGRRELGRTQDKTRGTEESRPDT